MFEEAGDWANIWTQVSVVDVGMPAMRIYTGTAGMREFDRAMRETFNGDRIHWSFGPGESMITVDPYDTQEPPKNEENPFFFLSRNKQKNDKRNI
jgi:hypothetical protein